MASLYRPLLKRAWYLAWKNPWLWVLGFFAALIGNGSVYESFFRFFSNLSDGRSMFETIKEYASSGIVSMISWENLVALWNNDSASFAIGIATIILFICLIVLFISFGVIGQAGLIKSVIAVDQGQIVGFKKAFKSGLEHFWSVLELNFITKVVIYGLLLLVVYLVSFIPFGNSLISSVVYVLLFLVFIILAIIIYFLTIYGTAFVVLRGKGVWASIVAAKKLFRANILLNLEVGIMLFLFNIVFVVAFVVILFLVTAPFLLLYFLSLMAGIGLAVSIFGFIIAVVFFVSLFFFSSWFVSFQLSVWALLFELSVLGKGQSKLLRIFSSFKKSQR